MFNLCVIFEKNIDIKHLWIYRLGCVLLPVGMKYTAIASYVISLLQVVSLTSAVAVSWF